MHHDTDHDIDKDYTTPTRLIRITTRGTGALYQQRTGIPMTEDLIALVALTAMEIVLGIDNIVFISILTSRLPAAQQPSARRLGLALAMGMRILLLFSLRWILKLEKPFLHLSDLHIPLDAWLSGDSLKAVDGVSVRDLILIAGGLFLIAKSVHEVHAKLEGADHRDAKNRNVTFGGVLVQIAVLDIVFSLDSVITAVGMAKELWVMITAVMLAVGVMMVFAGSVSRFVEKHPTIKMLALSFLILIGVMLVADGVGTHINKGYIYFAMCFALIVEFLNLRIRAASRTPDSTAKHEGA